MAASAEATETPASVPTPPPTSGTPRPIPPPVPPRPEVSPAATAPATAPATAAAPATATAARAARARALVIPPWRGAGRGNSATAAERTRATVANRTDTATSSPPTTTTTPEAARPSPISSTEIRPTLEERSGMESRTAWVRTHIIPSWAGASRDNIPAAATATAVNLPDRATPPPTTTAPEEARPSPISTTDARPTFEEPRARESRVARVRAYVIPPWAGAPHDNISTAATATAATSTAALAAEANRTGAEATPPPTITAPEAARPSPISTTADARPTLEEPRARDSRAARVRAYVIPAWAGASRDNSSAAAIATPATPTTTTAAVVNRTEAATPPAPTTAPEAARPSPVSTTADARPNLGEPRAIEARTTRVRNYVIPPWAGPSRDNSTTATAATAAATSAALAPAAAAPAAATSAAAAPAEATPAEETPAEATPTEATPAEATAVTAAAPTRAPERELTPAEAQAIMDAADMEAAEEVVAANEAADAFAVAQAIAASESSGTLPEAGSDPAGRSAGDGEGGRMSLALHHRVRLARERASSTSSDLVGGPATRDAAGTRLDSGWRTDGDLVRGGRDSRTRQGLRRFASSPGQQQTTGRVSDAETELDSASLTDLDERHVVLVQQDRVALPREREASMSSEQATSRRASDDAEMELDSGSQTDEGGDRDAGRASLVQEQARLPRGRTMRRSRDPARGRAQDDASSAAVAVAAEPSRRTQSSPPVLERPPPSPTARVRESGDASDTAASGSDAEEQTSPTTQAAATQTDMEEEEEEEEEEAPESSPAAGVADAQTETAEGGEEALVSPTAAQAAETQPEEEGKTAVGEEEEEEAEADDAGGVALGGSGGTVFPIVREDPDSGAAAFRSDSCAECQSLIVDASAHRDTVGMKGKVSGGLNADRCRNCWRVVCDSCVGTFWARTMVPNMYTRDSDSHRMRVCKTCHCAMEMFRKALLLGRVEEAMAAYGTGCVNLDTPYTIYHGELPVHCAAAGGNVVLLSWLVDELGCSLFVDEDLKKPLRDLRNLTVLGAAAVNAQVQTMRYLVNTKRCSLFEITHLPTMKKALEACLHVSPEAKFPLGARGSGPSGQQSNEIRTDISLRADGERSSYIDRGGAIVVPAVFGAASAFDDEDDCCIVCFDNEVACTLIPCGHHCCCRECAGRLTYCPVCRARITEMIKAIPV